MRRRDRMINVRMTEEEYEMLSAVAEHEGLNLSSWLRQAFRKAYKRLFGAPDPRPAKSGKHSD